MVNQDPITLLTSSQDLFSSQRDVTYSCTGNLYDGKRHTPFASVSFIDANCGACGYALNLSSSNRNTANIDSKYNKAIKKGVISFFYIDESRFTQVDELNCVPHFISKHSWGLFRPRTKLLCRKCGNHIGHAFEEITSPIGSENSDSNSSNGASVCRKFNVRIRALQPSSEDSGIPFVV